MIICFYWKCYRKKVKIYNIHQLTKNHQSLPIQPEYYLKVINPSIIEVSISCYELTTKLYLTKERKQKNFYHEKDTIRSAGTHHLCRDETKCRCSWSWGFCSGKWPCTRTSPGRSPWCWSGWCFRARILELRRRRRGVCVRRIPGRPK